jgi:hypothetical protein
MSERAGGRVKRELGKGLGRAGSYLYGTVLPTDEKVHWC